MLNGKSSNAAGFLLVGVCFILFVLVMAMKWNTIKTGCWFNIPEGIICVDHQQ